MGFTLKTDDKGCVIYKKERSGKNGVWYTYCTKVSSKDKDGNWSNAFIDIAFKKGVEVNNKAKINIKNAFPTLNTYNDKTTIRWMITEFDVVDEGEKPVDANADTSWMDADGLTEEMPFN